MSISLLLCQSILYFVHQKGQTVFMMYVISPQIHTISSMSADHMFMQCIIRKYTVENTEDFPGNFPRKWKYPDTIKYKSECIEE